MRICTRLVLLIVLFAFIYGCGFHLRRNQFQLGTKYPHIVLPYAGSHTFHQALRLALLTSSIRVVEDSDKRPAAPKLVVKSEEMTQQPLVYGPDSELRRERLKMTISFIFSRKDQHKLITLSAERDRQLNHSQHLGDNAEKSLIEKEMQTDIINQLLRYLDAENL